MLQVAQHTETRYQTAHDLRGIRDGNGQLEIQIEWEGLPDDVDLTRELLPQVFEDLPGLLEDFLVGKGLRTTENSGVGNCGGLELESSGTTGVHID